MKPTISRTRFSVLAGAVVCALLFGACGPAAAPPPPTRTPAPTFTPAPPVEPTPVDPAMLATAQAAQDQQQAEQAQQQPAADQPASEQNQGDAGQPAEQPQAEQPTPEPTATSTPEPKVPEVVTTQIVNIRGGPGTNYNLVGTANQDTRFRVTGKNQSGDWWQIDFNGQPAWVYGQLVNAQNTEGVAVAQNIPAAPVAVAPPPQPAATNTPAPAPQSAPTNTPAPAPPAQAPASNLPYDLLKTERCDPNPGTTYFNGYVRDSNNNPVNAVCLHIAFYEPRTTKCSGCDGVGDGVWGFSPFGGPAPRGVPIEIFVVECPASGVPTGGMGSDFGNLTPQSPKWTRTIGDSEQCTGITFVRK